MFRNLNHQSDQQCATKSMTAACGDIKTTEAEAREVARSGKNVPAAVIIRRNEARRDMAGLAGLYTALWIPGKVREHSNIEMDIGKKAE